LKFSEKTASHQDLPDLRILAEAGLAIEVMDGAIAAVL